MLDRRASERLVALEQELTRRRSSDALFRWEPHEKQKPFVDSVLDGRVPENWLIASNRSGKSESGAYCGAMLARFGSDAREAYGADVDVFDRATSGWVVTLDFPAARDIIQPKYFDNGFMAGVSHPPFIPDREIAEWRVSDQVLKLKGPGTGSIITFKSCESGRVKFQGAGLDWIHFDEEPPKPIYEESVIRVGAGRKLRVFGTCTLLPPEGMVGGVSWLYSNLIQPWERGELRHLVQLFSSSIYDNPHISPEEISRLESIYPEGSIQRRIRLGGEWLPGLAGSRAYGAFARSLHLAEQPPLVARRPLCWVWDFNVEPLVSLVGQREGRLFRVLRELVLDEGNVPDMVTWFRELYPTHTAEVWLYGDATGRGREAGTGKSDYQLILNAMRNYGPPVRLRVPESNPHVRDRINAVNHALKNEHGEIGVLIDPSCQELTADLEQVLSDPHGGIKKTNNRHDPYFRRTHTCLLGSTLVETPSGQVPIADIRSGDYVMTPAGPAVVELAGLVGAVSELVEVGLSNGSSIIATPQHKFLTERGLVTADALGYDVLLEEEHPLCRLAVSNSRAVGFSLGLRKAITELTAKGSCICIAPSGRQLTGPFRRDTRFITSTGTPLITDLISIGTRKTQLAVVSVARHSVSPTAVYDLTIRRHRCYVAEGALVSNSDALGYWIVYEEPVRAYTASPPAAGRSVPRIAHPQYGFTGQGTEEER